MNMKFYVLKDKEHSLPMPDRGGRLFGKDGEFINQHDPFYAQCIREGCLVEDKKAGEARKAAAAKESKPAGSDDPEAAASGAGNSGKGK